SSTPPRSVASRVPSGHYSFSGIISRAQPRFGPVWANVAPVTFLLHVINALRLLVVADALFTFALKPDQFPRSLTKPLLDPISAPGRETFGRGAGHIALPPLVAPAFLCVLQAWAVRQRARSGAD